MTFFGKILSALSSRRYSVNALPLSEESCESPDLLSYCSLSDTYPAALRMSAAGIVRSALPPSACLLSRVLRAGSAAPDCFIETAARTASLTVLAISVTPVRCISVIFLSAVSVRTRLSSCSERRLSLAPSALPVSSSSSARSTRKSAAPDK